MGRRIRWIVTGAALLALVAPLAAMNRLEAYRALLSTPGLAPGKKDVDIVSVSQLGNSATVEARLDVSLLLGKKGGQWRVEQIRMPDGAWQDVDALRAALQDLRFVETRRLMLELVGALLLRFAETADFPRAEAADALCDVLCPAWLVSPVVFDAWKTPLAYICTDGKTYEIRSAGPDRSLNTADDIVLRNGRFVPAP